MGTHTHTHTQKKLIQQQRPTTMRAVVALMLAGLSCASPIAKLALPSPFEIDLTEDVVNQDGLDVRTSVSFAVEVNKGVAVINDKYLVPVGVAKFTLQTAVNEYVVSPSGTRLAMDNEKIPVQVSVAAQVAFDAEHHMHVQLQVLEAEGKDLSMQHFTEIELMLDEDKNERYRIPCKAPKAIAPTDIETAEQADMSSSEDDESSEDVSSEDLDLVLVSDELDEKKCKLVKWYNSQPVGVRVGVSVGGAVVFALVFVALVKCMRCCCCPEQAKRRAPPPKGKFYVRNIHAANSKRAFVPLKQYKFQKLATKA